MLNSGFPSSSDLTRINRWILALVVGGLFLGMLFGLRSGNSFFRIQQAGLHPGMRDPQAIRGWMTIPYISRIYRIPANDLYQAINVTPTGNNRKSLDELNRLYNPLMRGAILNSVKQAVADFNVSHPIPTAVTP
jgi:hypothetical protein